MAVYAPQIRRGEPMSQPKPVLPSQPRLRSLARLDGEIVKAEADYTRWVTLAKDLRARRLDNRAALGLVGVVQARLAQLHRSRTVLLEGDAGRDEPEGE